MALQGVEAQLLTLALHLKKGLHLWAASIASEPWPLESLQEEAEGTAVARLAKRLAEADAAAASLLLHPSVAPCLPTILQLLLDLGRDSSQTPCEGLDRVRLTPGKCWNSARSCRALSATILPLLLYLGRDSSRTP